MKRFSMRWWILISIMLCARPCWADSRPILRLSGPALAETLPLLAMAEARPPWPQDFEVQFTPWNSPDQLRALIAGQQVDGAIMTTSAASIFYHRGVATRVVVLHEAPIFVVSSQTGSDRLESLTGTLLFPFGPGEMPELLFRAVLPRPGSDLVVHHTGSPLEAVNLLLAGRAEQALLSEPAASLALVRSRALAGKGAPRLEKRIDLRKVWQDSFEGRRLLVSCLALIGPAARESNLPVSLARAYVKASEWIAGHPEEGVRLAEKRFPALAAQAVDGRLPGQDLRAARGPAAQEEALFFLEKIRTLSPRAVGGPLPEDDFFETRP